MRASTSQNQHYDIRVGGHLAARWNAWFDGFTLTAEQDGTTVLHGVLPDQSALHGTLQKLRDAGIPLLSINPTDTPRSSS